MKYGHFDDKNKEYVISTPATPSPWINYLGDQDFFSLISNTCGGYSFYKDAKLRRITRYRYNDVPNDMDGRHVYIKEGSLIWSPTFLPAKTPLDSYECRHGLGYSIFEGKKNEIDCRITCFVPLKESCEIQEMEIHNYSNKVRNLNVFSQIEWCLWNASDDGENFQRNLSTGEVECYDGIIYHKSEYRERRNHYAFYYVNEHCSHFESDRDHFLGRFNGYESPEEITKGNLGDYVASGWHPIAAHQLDVSLKPGESKKIIFILGYCEVDPEEKFVSLNVINKAPAEKLIAKFNNAEKVEKALSEIKKHWDDLLSIFHVDSGDEKLDRMANIWNQYQCMVTYMMSRSASYYESGIGRGMGFRDSCQDLLGFVHLIPSKARERILDIASIQKEDGSTYHQYQPLTKKGNSGIGSGFNDDPLWLVAATSAYLKETGDFDILNEPVPFDSLKGSEKPLKEHLKASIHFTISHRGPHGLPLIGRADWNDCLNLNCFSSTPGESFQTTANKETGIAESIFIAGMFVKYGKEYAEIMHIIGQKDEEKETLKAVKEVSDATLKYGWDGSYFLRAYDAYGNKVGSHENKEGQIFIEPQGFCVMAGIGHDEGYGHIALSSAERLLGNRWGLELLHPCYTTYHLELGEISSYPPGYKENGAVFNHNNPWVVIAHAVEGEDKEAFELYKKNAPAYIEEYSDIHYTEPYVYSQMIAGRDAKNYGQAKNSWLSGSATWSFVALSQYLLGVKPTFEGLSIEPHLPKDSFKNIQIKRIYRNVVYDIHIDNTKDKKTLYVDGAPLVGHVIPFLKSSKEVKVELK
ncbi:MAG: glycosyl transferase [Bacilli bacterium]|jgi:cellobiose phosphorylase|nr:glycosyl transferase [Bacilli bacterium]MCH4228975.1 glycosyl transferase [Bacilli bacterium]MCH4277739.1 glycosyl transferase [Bacilli bacterium]